MSVWNAARGPEDAPVDPRGSGRGRFSAGTPEDVAALYTWANLQGARYRDFSASRKRYREKVRAQAAEGSATAGSLEQTRVARAAGPAESASVPVSLEERRKGGAGMRWAVAQRGWDSSSRSVECERMRAESGRVRASPEPGEHFFETAIESFEPIMGTDEPEPVHVLRPVQQQRREALEWAAEADLGGAGADPLYRGGHGSWETEPGERVDPPGAEMDERVGMEAGPQRPSGTTRAWEPERLLEAEPEVQGPAWLYGPQPGSEQGRVMNKDQVAQALAEVPRAASVNRWSALRDVVETEWSVPRETRSAIPVGRRAPLLLLFSLAGGVGKTSLMAMLGRALSASGERVVLGDSAPYSLLPFYFGGRELRPGQMRAFAPPEESGQVPVFLANYELSRAASDPQEQGRVMGEILRNGAECHRILLDVPAAADWLVRRLATLQPTVLVPLVPDMSAVVSLENVERYFDRFADADGYPVLPFYVLSQFDSTLKLHVDVREVLRGRLGERLLSFAVRRSAAVSEALAEGVSVADYAPESPVARDYFDVAAWLKTVSPPAGLGVRSVRSGQG